MQRRYRRRLHDPKHPRVQSGAVVIAAVTAVVTLAAACGSSGGGHAAGSATQKPSDVKFSTSGAYIAYAPVFVAQAKGYFKQQGLSVDVLINSDPQATAASLVNNNVQFNLQSASHDWQADLTGRPSTIIAANDGQLAQTLVISKKAYQSAGLTSSSSLADRINAMRGLTFGVRSLATQDGATLLNILKYGGMTKSDVKFVTLTSPPALVSAMKTKHIDGFVSGAPFPQQVVSQGLAVNLIDLQAGDFPPFRGMIADAYATSQTFLKAHPDQVQAFVNAIAMADRYIHLHPQQAAKTLHATKDFKALPLSMLSSQLTQMSKSHALPPDPTITAAALKRGMPLLAAALGKEPTLDITSTFTNKFAAKAVPIAKAKVK